MAEPILDDSGKPIQAPPPESKRGEEEEEIYDEEDFGDYTDEQLGEESQKKLKEGLELFKARKLEEAVQILQTALKMRIIRFGQLHYETAKYYLAYGKSLLHLVQAQSSVLGGNDKKKETTTMSKTEPKAAETKSTPQVEKPPQPTPPSKSQRATLIEDRQLAWENLEIARVILTKEVKDAETLADCFQCLGDISMENEKWQEATEDYIKSAKIMLSIHGEASQQAAADFVTAAVACVYNNKTQEAYTFYVEALTCLDLRIRELMGDDYKLEPADKEAEEEEELVLLEASVVEDWIRSNSGHENLPNVKDIWSFCEEISERLDSFTDLENVQAKQTDVAEIVAQMLAQEMAKMAQAAAEDDGPINDLGVVTSRRNPQEESREPSKTPAKESAKRPLGDGIEPASKKARLCGDDRPT